MPEIRKYPVIISATHDKRWDAGLGRLYDPFEESEEGYLYSILHVEASVNIPHGQCGYYPITSATVDSARKNGLVLTDGQGNQCGFDRPESRPYGSLDKAIQHLEKKMQLQSEEVPHAAR